MHRKSGEGASFTLQVVHFIAGFSRLIDLFLAWRNTWGGGKGKEHPITAPGTWRYAETCKRHHGCEFALIDPRGLVILEVGLPFKSYEFHSEWYACWLVVWNIFLFSHILGIIIPIDELIFFRGVVQPPTSEWYAWLGRAKSRCWRWQCQGPRDLSSARSPTRRSQFEWCQTNESLAGGAGDDYPGGTKKWMVDSGKMPLKYGFRGTPVLGNLQIGISPAIS